MRAHFVREYILDGIIQIEFVKFENKDADINTKNTGEELFNKHTRKFLQDLPKGFLIQIKTGRMLE